ncbi:MAG: glycosyltransferase family 4 protein [Candidatus Aminicenantes bacterium]
MKKLEGLLLDLEKTVNSDILQNRQDKIWEDLNAQIFISIKKNPESAETVLKQAVPIIKKRFGLQSAYNLIMRLESSLAARKPRMGIYDNAFHFVGGAQKYGCTIANALQNDFDITFIGHQPVELKTLKKWYDIDLSRCRTKFIPLPYFESRHPEKEIFDAGEVDLRGENPFHAISRESGNYDFFVNNCMLEMVYPLANTSEFVCHFPERERSRFFHVDSYSHIIFNSQYTAEWIRKRWQLDPHVHIYPPVDTQPLTFPSMKKNWILSVSRFEPGGIKQQQEMVRVFLQMKQNHPDQMKSWRLVLAGGSIRDNPYLDGVKRMAALGKRDIDVLVNVPIGKLTELYRSAAIFWHFSGLDQSHPERIEHFGMTTVEAMQNGCVPVVFKGGGQKEIIEDGQNGQFFITGKEAMEFTLGLIKNQERRKELSRNSFNRGKDFTKNIFIQKVKKHFLGLLKQYRFENQFPD